MKTTWITTLLALAITGCSAKIEGTGKAIGGGGGGGGNSETAPDSTGQACGSGYAPIAMKSTVPGATETSFEKLPSGTKLEYQGMEYYLVITGNSADQRFAVHTKESFESGAPAKSSPKIVCNTAPAGMVMASEMLASYQVKATGATLASGRKITTSDVSGKMEVTSEASTSSFGDDVSYYLNQWHEHTLYRISDTEYALHLHDHLDGTGSMDRFAIVHLKKSK